MKTKTPSFWNEHQVNYYDFRPMSDRMRLGSFVQNYYPTIRQIDVIQFHDAFKLPGDSYTVAIWRVKALHVQLSHFVVTPHGFLAN